MPRKTTDARRKQRAMSCLWPRLISSTAPLTGVLTAGKFRTQLFFPMMHTHWPAAADSLLHCQQLETQEENKQDLGLRARRDAICPQGKQPAGSSCGVLAPTFAAPSDNWETAAPSCSVGTTGRRDVRHPPPAAPSHILLSACADAVSRRAFSDSVLVNVSTHFFCCWSPTRSSVLLYSAPPGGVTGILLCSVEINYVRTSEANTRRALPV